MPNFDRIIDKILKEQTTAPNPVQQALPIPSTQTGQLKTRYPVKSVYAKVLPSQQKALEPARPLPATRLVLKNSYEDRLNKTIQKSEKDKLLKSVEQEDAENEVQTPDSLALKIIDIQLPSVQQKIKENEQLMNQSRNDAVKFNQYSGVSMFWKGVEYGFNYIKKNITK